MPLFALRAGVFASTLACSLVAFSVQAAGTNSYTYTDLGQLASVDGPRTDVSDITHYAYDAQDNLTTITNALDQSVTLANLGNAQTVTDPMASSAR